MQSLFGRLIPVLLALFIVSGGHAAAIACVPVPDAPDAPCIPDLPPPTPADVIPPSVVSITTPSVEVNAPYVVTVTFSEDVTGFELTDIENLAGDTLTLSNLAATSGRIYTFTASGPDGNHRLHVVNGSVQDTAGNTSDSSETELSLLYDTTPPIVTVTNAPTNGSTTSGPVVFEMTSLEESATFTCTFVSGPVAGGEQFPCGPGELSIFRPIELSDGVYTFTVFGTDERGNAGTPATDDGTLITFTLDTTYPEVSIVTPVPTPSSAAPVLVISSNEPVTLSFFGPCGVATPTTIPAGNSGLTFNPLSPGTYSTQPFFTEESETLAVTQVPILEGVRLKELFEGGDYAHMCIFTATDAAGHTVFHSIATFIIDVAAGGGGGNGPVTVVTSNSGNTSPTVTMTPSGPQPGEGNRVLSGQTGPQSGTPQFASTGTGGATGGATGGGTQQPTTQQPIAQVKPKPKLVTKALKKKNPPLAQKSAPKLPDPLTPPPTTQTAGAAASTDPFWKWFAGFFWY